MAKKYVSVTVNQRNYQSIPKALELLRFLSSQPGDMSQALRDVMICS